MDAFLPHVVSWNVTQRCNLRCRHCYIDASRSAPSELTTSEGMRILDEIAALSPETMLILSGGEPLCRPDLDELVAHASGLGMTVVLGTNGTLLDPGRARSLAGNGLAAVGISLDSLLPSRHDVIRATEGAWSAALRGVKASRDAGLEVQIQATFFRENLEELPRIEDFVRGTGARVLTVFFLVCTGRGQDVVDITPDEYERALASLADPRESGVMVRRRCAPTFRRILAQRDSDSILLRSDAARCMAARSYCRITPEGEVTPCPYMPRIAGSLREQGFAEIWRSAPLLASLRAPTLGGRCGACEYSELCGGCRARALALGGDPLGEDPWCTYEPGTDPPLRRDEVPAPSWSAEAEVRLGRVPFFVRGVVRSAVEALARRQGLGEVTPRLLDDARRIMGRR